MFTTMTLKEHIKTAKALVKARNDLIDMSCSGPKRLKRIYKSEALRISKVIYLIDDVKNTMDNVYCRLVDKKTLKKLGFIYYKVD